MELCIPLPTMSDGRMPKDLSYRWCKALHEALQPLRKYRLVDDSDAIGGQIAAGFKLVVDIHGTFDEPVKFDSLEENSAVLRIMLSQSSERYLDMIYFHYKDFLDDGGKAREKFARVIAHLEEHAVPQIAPEWITRIMSALQSK